MATGAPSSGPYEHGVGTAGVLGEAIGIRGDEARWVQGAATVIRIQRGSTDTVRQVGAGAVKVDDRQLGLQDAGRTGTGIRLTSVQDMGPGH